MERSVVEQKLKEITEKIVTEFQPEKIILFGSWAWGNPGPDSDVDLLIVMPSREPLMQREQKVRDVLRPVEFAFDILVRTRQELEHSINNNRNLFFEDIVRNGRALYSKVGSEIRIVSPKPLVIVS